MKNWLTKIKKNKEKLMNVLFKFTATLCFLNAILYICNLYQPSKLNILANYLALGFIFTFVKYTSKK